MTDNTFSKAKQALLASGLPLEMSVERRLRAMEFHQVTADFSYWRRSQGGPKDFSVDVRAMRSIPTAWVTTTPEGAMCGASIHGTWDILFECKYRNPSVKWVFAPLPNPMGPGMPGWWPHRKTHFFVNGRGHCALGPVEAGHLDVLVRDANGKPDLTGVPILVTRGVEFRPGGGKEESDEAFSAPIRRGVYQLQFAHVPRLDDAMRWVGSLRGSEGAPWPDIHLDVSSLILVTTAELWTFRADVDLDTIEDAQTLDDIAERVNVVEYATVSSRELRAHQDEWLTAIERTRTFGPPEQESQQRQLWKIVADAVRAASPSVLIVHHDDLEGTLNAQAEAIRVRIRQMTDEFARARGLIVR